MSESDTVQRVRVVDAWAVKTAKGRYLDAHAVNVVNTIIIVLLVVLSIGWLAGTVLEFNAISFEQGSDPRYWYWSSVGFQIIVMVYRFIVALMSLGAVGLIIEHRRHTSTLIVVFSLVMFIGGWLTGGTDAAYQFSVTGPYLIVGFLAALTREYYR